MTSRKNKPVFVSHSRTLEGDRNCPRDVSDASRWVGVLPHCGERFTTPGGAQDHFGARLKSPVAGTKPGFSRVAGAYTSPLGEQP